MINHVVLFKLKKYASESEKQNMISVIEDALLSLSGKIAELKHVEVGVNYELVVKYLQLTNSTDSFNFGSYLVLYSG